MELLPSYPHSHCSLSMTANHPAPLYAPESEAGSSQVSPEAVTEAPTSLEGYFCIPL